MIGDKISFVTRGNVQYVEAMPMASGQVHGAARSDYGRGVISNPRAMIRNP